MRSPSVFASLRARSTVSLLSFSPCATMSDARVFASESIVAICFSARERLWRPSSPAASPSAICFCRASMARISGGQTNFAQNQMKTPKATACISSVRLMFMTGLYCNVGARPLFQARRNQRIPEREQHCDAQPDDERRIDQAEQQEHLRLQRRDHFRLARGALK